MEIRELTAADAGSYRELRLYSVEESPAAFGPTPTEVAALPPEVYAERLADEQNHTFGAFAAGGQLAGVTVLRRESREKSRHKDSIFSVYVRPEFRGQGVGRALMEAALARARERGLRQVTLGVNAASEAAVRVYEACGFERYGLERDALKLGEQFYDMIYMVYWVPGES